VFKGLTVTQIFLAFIFRIWNS